MSEEWRKVEDLLSEMPLRKPPAGFDERVLPGRALRSAHWLWALVPTGAAAAAVLAAIVGGAWLKHCHDAEKGDAVTMTVANGSDSRSAGPAARPPVVATWTQTSYEGTVLLGDESPAYAFVRRGVQEAFWVDPETGARIATRVPTKNVIFIKAQID